MYVCNVAQSSACIQEGVYAYLRYDAKYSNNDDDGGGDGGGDDHKNGSEMPAVKHASLVQLRKSKL